MLYCPPDSKPPDQSLLDMIWILSCISKLFITLIYTGNLCSQKERENIHTFKEYKTCYKYSFHPNDESLREDIFLTNLRTVQTLRSSNPKTKFALNEFSHLSHAEFIRTFLGFKSPKTYDPEYVKGPKNFSVVDWREKGVVSDIQNQGMCGSCYSFNSISTMESHNAIKTGNLIKFSEQQIVDCSKSYGNYGCQGGFMDNVFNYTKDVGLMTAYDYPYIAKKMTCDYNKDKIALKITGWTNIKTGSEKDLTEAIRNIGPVAIAIDGGQPSFMFYSSGVYNDVNCSSYQLNHGVTAVGVTKDYYIIRNSWGTSWGEGGYVKIARNRGNRCGIATAASYPNLSR